MYYSAIDTFLDRNLRTIDGFPLRQDLNQPIGNPDEVHDDRWSEIVDDEIRSFKGTREEGDFEERSSSAVNSPLSSDEQSRVDRAIREIGFEAIAFYKSRRFIQQRPFIGKWGIFYIRAGIEHLATRMARDYAIGNSLDVAYELLRRHERYHFKADLYTMMLELVNRQQLYVPVRRAYRGRSAQFVEEALANRAVWTHASHKGGSINEFALDWMTIQPSAYGRFREYPKSLRAEWAANTLDGDYAPRAHRNDLEAWTVSVPDSYDTLAACPEWTIESGISSALFPPALRMPVVRAIEDSDAVLKVFQKKYQHLERLWANQKQKLHDNPALRGLDFYPWKVKPLWSMRVNDNFRAHLRERAGEPGYWVTEKFGTHKELGHG